MPEKHIYVPKNRQILTLLGTIHPPSIDDKNSLHAG
jgi:flagellar basal body L-ring protein FlgH